MQKLTKFKVIFDLFTVCVYFIQQQNCKLYYIQHAHSRTAVRNSRTETVMHALIIWYLRAKT